MKNKWRESINKKISLLKNLSSSEKILSSIESWLRRMKEFFVSALKKYPLLVKCLAIISSLFILYCSLDYLFNHKITILELVKGKTKSLEYTIWDYLFKKHDAIRSLGLVIAAIIGLPLYIWRGFSLEKSAKASQESAKASQESAKASQESAKASQEQAKIASESHVADTYTRAIEQLGANSKENQGLELRIGGLYALEKIAQTKKDYHKQIMEVLCAYVRTRASKDNSNNDDGQKIDIPEEAEEDIKICLTIIGRRNLEHEADGRIILNLLNTNLIGADLREANLSRANLYRADLVGADLREANLSGANLYRANLTRVNLYKADLTKADLTGADLTRVYLYKADLIGADLIGADLTEAILIGADLTGALNLDKGQLELAAILLNNNILCNNPYILEEIKNKYKLLHKEFEEPKSLTEILKNMKDTVLPDYLEIEQKGDHGFTVKRIV